MIQIISAAFAILLLFSLSVSLGVAASSDHTDSLLGVEVITGTLPIYDDAGRGQFRDQRDDDAFPPLRVLLSRHRYWLEDGHLDVLVRLTPAEGGLPENSTLQGRLLDVEDQEIDTFTVDPVPGAQFMLYPRLPADFTGAGSLELTWTTDGEVLARDQEPFRVEPFETAAAPEGRVALEVKNPDGLHQTGLPITMGVPFPRGILWDTTHLRLVDAQGEEVPLQVRETARWSKFGSVKWILCDFTTDLTGEPRQLFLEYGPDITRTESPAMTEAAAKSFPVFETGVLKFDHGLWFDPKGDGKFVKILEARTLHGAFVEHEDGRLYQMPDGTFEIEENGSEKVVVRSAGWFEDGTGTEFCQYVARFVIHRDSPLLRVFYTWIFTGDGSRDRIANMGWELALAEGMQPDGFLLSFDEAEWQPGRYLLQYDYNRFDVVAENDRTEFDEGRAPGAAAVAGNGVRLYFGAKDFWQNYPSELEFADRSLWFHNWPRHNRPATTTYDDPEDPELNLNVTQLRFAHEGEILDFRLPDAFGENPIWVRMSGGEHRQGDWNKGQVETVNAEGISRTEEFWLWLTPETSPAPDAARFLKNLNDETLRAFPDPEWVAQSGAFYEMHHQDWEQFPEEERIYELLALAPAQWQERLGMYGMWLHGDLFAWSSLNLDSKNPTLYRALRKAHHGWPYSWIPYARSGDPRLLKSAQAALRQLIDASYSHYASEEVDQRMGPDFRRRIGLSNTGPLPWAGAANHMTRSMHNKYHPHWQAYYLTGYHRAKDNIMSWAEQVKNEEPGVYGRGPFAAAPRTSVTMMKSWLEMYEATFDPWFLAASHALAEGHLDGYRQGRLHGHFYNSGDREYMRYTDDPDFREYYLAYAERYGDPRFGGGSWGRIGAPVVESQAYAWKLTDDDDYLRRTAHFVDWVTQAVYDADEPEYVTGAYTYGHATPIFTGWGLDYFPTALAALAAADERPDSLGPGFNLRRRDPMPEVKLLKPDGEPLEFVLAAQVVGDRFPGYHAVDRGETRPFKVSGPDGEVVLSGEYRKPANSNRGIPRPPWISHSDAKPGRDRDNAVQSDAGPPPMA